MLRNNKYNRIKTKEITNSIPPIGRTDIYTLIRWASHLILLS